MITCPNCGEIAKNEIKIYNEGLRKQNFSITPILPKCRHCYAEVAISHTCNGGNIIVLNGTCGSGKSTVAELLADKGFLAIDGDCVMQVVRYKKNIKQVAFCDMLDEIASEIDILSIFSDNIVLSHVILSEDLDKYIEIFEARNMNYKFFLLKPDYQTAVERCQTRTCHTSVTPEYWIKHFYDLLVFDERVEVVDNTNMTAEQTAECILDRFVFLPDASKSVNDIIDIKNHLLDEDVLYILKESIYDSSGTGKRLRERTEQYTKDENTYAYGYKQNDKSAGVIIVDIGNPQEMAIKEIAVAPDKQNCGIGSKLIDYVRGQHIPVLLTAETDGDAVKFYRKYGFTVTSLGEKYPGCIRYRCEMKG